MPIKIQRTMIPLENVRWETFAPLEGRAFRVIASGVSVELVLKSVTKLGHPFPGATRDPFSLLFGGEHGLRLRQGIYQFSCDEFGEIEIFISQLSDGPVGTEFEAIFN